MHWLGRGKSSTSGRESSHYPLYFTLVAVMRWSRILFTLSQSQESCLHYGWVPSFSFLDIRYHLMHRLSVFCSCCSNVWCLNAVQLWCGISNMLSAECFRTRIYHQYVLSWLSVSVSRSYISKPCGEHGHMRSSTGTYGSCSSLLC